MKEVIVREYLESLKEDKELDLLFPMLLEVMGFIIVTSPKEYKGHKQYGKDIIAYGYDPYDNIKKRFYFELKGGRDRNIDVKTFAKDDGIRMSIIEAKDRDYSNNSIEGFNGLPVKIVIVHNGVISPDVSDTFEGFITREFPKDGSFEFARWDISKLTSLFSEHLFNEYLLTNEENTRLFKRMLVFMDVPENSQRDFYSLVHNIISKTDKGNISKTNFPVHLIRFFETLKLISLITHQYAREANNLEISKKCIPYLVLRVWCWIISNHLEKNKRVLGKFQEIFLLHKSFLSEYFTKMLPISQTKYGLFSENSGRYEQIGFPMRCMEYLSYLNYWLLIQDENELSIDQKNGILTTFIDCNDGTCRPLLDNHSIPIFLTISFYVQNGKIDNAKNYLAQVFEQIIISKNFSGWFPDGKNNPESLIRLIARREKSIYYEDKASMLIGMLFELLAAFKMESAYYEFRSQLIDIQLSTFIPFSDNLLHSYFPDISNSHEELLFSHELYEEGYQSEIKLDENFLDFYTKTKNKKEYEIEYRTAHTKFSVLLKLAHLYYNTPFFPQEWRSMFDVQEKSIQ